MAEVILNLHHCLGDVLAGNIPAHGPQHGQGVAGGVRGHQGQPTQSLSSSLSYNCKESASEMSFFSNRSSHLGTHEHKRSSSLVSTLFQVKFGGSPPDNRTQQILKVELRLKVLPPKELNCYLSPRATPSRRRARPRRGSARSTSSSLGRYSAAVRSSSLRCLS